MDKKLIELLEDIGQSFFRSGNDLENNKILDSIKEISANIAELNKNCSVYINLTNENSDNKEKEEKIVSELNSISARFNAVYQKIGVELYGNISLNDIEDLKIKNVYEKILQGEKESENIERDIYKLENSVLKKNLLNNVVSPIKLSRLKNKLQMNNKKNLKTISDLGKIYCDVKDRISLRVSIDELNDEYESLLTKFKTKKSSLDSIKEKIDDTSKKIISLGTKSKIENEINNNENKLKSEFFKLGQEVYDNKELSLSRELELKINNYTSLKIKYDLKQYNDDLLKKKDRLKRLTLKISKKRDELKILDDENSEIEVEIKKLEDQINSGQAALEDLVLE